MGCLFPSSMQAQTRSINKFINKYQSSEGAEKINIPGWLIELGTGIGKMAVESEEEKELLKIVKKINKVKILSMEAAETIKDKDLKKLYTGLENESFEKMIQVKDGKSRFSMMVREKRGKLKNFVLVADDDGEFSLISIKTRLSMEMINELIKKLSEEFEVDLGIPEEIQEEEIEKIQV